MAVRSANSSSPLTVWAVSAAVASDQGQCPSATYAFTGTDTTNGRPGRIETRWRQPDGTLSEPVIDGVPAGASTVISTLEFTVTGDRAADSAAVFEVLSRLRQHSAPLPLHYLC